MAAFFYDLYHFLSQLTTINLTQCFTAGLI